MLLLLRLLLVVMVICGTLHTLYATSSYLVWATPFTPLGMFFAGIAVTTWWSAIVARKNTDV